MGLDLICEYFDCAGQVPVLLFTCRATSADFADAMFKAITSRAPTEKTITTRPRHAGPEETIVECGAFLLPAPLAPRSYKPYRPEKPTLRPNYHPDERLGAQFNACLSELRNSTKKGHHFCFFCGEELDETNATRDHIHPLSKGGKVKVQACRRCNHRKGSMSVDDFRAKYFNSEYVFWGERLINR